MKTKPLLGLLLLNAAVSTAAEIEIPVYPGSSIEYEESMQSSKPDIVMRDIQILSPATDQQLLDFYKKSPFIKHCKENTMADNFVCDFTPYKGVKNGNLFIDRKMKKGKTGVYANYFSKK